MTRARTLLVAALSVTACATTPKVLAESLPACAAGRAPDGWHQVDADRLTLCVPGDWRSAGPRSWRSDGGQLTWGWGPGPRRVATAVVTVRGGQPVRPQIEGQLTGRVLHRSTEKVGGHLVDLSMTELNGEYHVVAEWKAGQSLVITGEARRRSAAEEQLRVVRTVRLAESE